MIFDEGIVLPASASQVIGTEFPIKGKPDQILYGYFETKLILNIERSIEKHSCIPFHSAVHSIS